MRLFGRRQRSTPIPKPELATSPAVVDPFAAFDPDEIAFTAAMAHSLPHMRQFWTETLARLLLSYVPMIDFLARAGATPTRIGSFGSGSCSHEAFLVQAFPDALVEAYDASSKYIPPYTRAFMEETNRLTFRETGFESLLWSECADRYDLVFSIQTLEHIDDWHTALMNLAASVKPDGLLYIDTPYYSERDELQDPEYLVQERKRQWDKHEHYHLGFSLTRMQERVEAAGFEVLQGGYSAYPRGDARLLQDLRGLGTWSREKPPASFVLSWALQLRSVLALCERRTAAFEGDIESIHHKDRHAGAIRLLARRRASVDASETAQ